MLFGLLPEHSFSGCLTTTHVLFHSVWHNFLKYFVILVRGQENTWSILSFKSFGLDNPSQLLPRFELTAPE